MPAATKLANDEFTAGDPIDIRLRFIKMNLMGYTYAAQIKARLGDAVPLAAFTVSTAYDDPDTVIDLHLDGDSDFGATPSVNRTFPRSVYWDIQPYDSDGNALATMLTQKLIMAKDVSV